MSMETYNIHILYICTVRHNNFLKLFISINLSVIIKEKQARTFSEKANPKRFYKIIFLNPDERFRVTPKIFILNFKMVLFCIT